VAGTWETSNDAKCKRSVIGDKKDLDSTSKVALPKNSSGLLRFEINFWPKE
jgi:hypothetical protein